MAQSCPALCDPLEYSPPGSSVHWIFQATTLEWVAISFYRGSSRPRDQTRVSCIAGGFFTAEPSRRPYSTLDLSQEAEKRSFGQNIPIHDILRHLYVKGSQILWGCVCVCVRVGACMFRVLLLPLPPLSGGSQVSWLESLDCVEPRPQQHPCYGRETSLVDSEKSLGMFSAQRAPSGP